MPPKKAGTTKAPTFDENGDVKFSWTPDNERRLLTLAIRSSIGGADYHQFLKAMPPGLSYEGLRQKFQKFKREQKAIYEEMGWTLSDSCPTNTTAKPATGASNTKKRSINGDGGDDDEEDQPADKPAAKKPRGKKAQVATETEQDQEDGGDEVPEKPARKPRAKKQTAAAAPAGEGGKKQDAEKPVKKGRGRPKKNIKVEESEEDSPAEEVVEAADAEEMEI